jgi:multiple sugar transport system ATP-binding protein
MTANEANSRDDAHLELRNLHKEYPGGVTAVEDVSLTLPRGELLVLVGPSGCGKSTTLRMVAGLEEPTDGDVLIGGESVTGRRPEDREIAMVFQNYALYPHKTARENIGFGLRMTTDLPDDEVSQRVADVAETLGITDLLEKKPGSLSGGQQQRVALGRAIVRDPAVFLLDEPLSNLDATLRGRMRTEIQQLQRDLDVTTVYVTHDQVEAMTIGDRIAVLDDGHVQQVGTPMTCYHEPANRFVASFIGEPSMNLLDCEFDRVAGTFDGPVTYPASDELATAAADADGSGVTLGFRPEAPTLVDPPTARESTERGAADGGGTETDAVTTDEDEALTFPGQVDVVEPVGERSFVYVTLADGPQVTIAVPGGTAVGERRSVGVHLPLDGVHLFDAATGRALHHPEWEADESLVGVATGRSDA